MRVLIIEEDPNIMRDILDEVEKNYLVDVAYNAAEGTYLSQVNDYDAIVVDSTLSDMDGVEVCKTTRSANVDAPIVLISDEKCVSYKVRSLDAGADCLLGKPIDTTELLAEMRTLIRRKSGFGSNNEICLGRISLDVRSREVKVDDRAVVLRRKEYDVFEYLVFNKGRNVSKEELLEHVWRSGVYILSNTVEVTVKSLRDKLEECLGCRLIKTVPGFGYRLESIQA